MTNPKESWLFGDIPRGSKLGVLLEVSARRAVRSQPELKGLDLKKRTIEELNQMAGCDIKAYDFLALGLRYLATEPGKRAACQLNKFVNELEISSRKESIN